MPPHKIRNACYTLNNYNTEQVTALKELPCTYHVMGFEVGDSGTPHVQGFICFKNPRSFKAVHKQLFKSHIETMRGTHKQASDYCKKGDEFWEFGELPAPGARSDIVQIRDSFRDDYAGDVDRMIDDHPHIHRYEKLLVRLAKRYSPKRNWPMEVYWFYGDARSGKTRTAWETCKEKELSVYMHTGDTRNYWDNYDREEVIIWDDFRSTQTKYAWFLRFLDRFPMMLAARYYDRPMLAKVIYITCINHPRVEFASYDDEPINQIVGRITEIREFRTGKDPKVEA